MTQQTQTHMGYECAFQARFAPAEQCHGLEEGGEVCFRYIRADDYPLVHEFVHSLSPDTAYKRFMGARKLSDDEIRQWTKTDPSREFTLVALAGTAGSESIVGVVTCVFESPDTTDFAMVLADAWQGRGIGRDLMFRLMATARQLGLRKLSGTTLSTNVAMLSLARKLGFRTTRLIGEFVNTLSLEL
ncbi:MAG TPA: GNAT family N-acetyltransferase [Ramlibacter sp.]|nr:GNAT family N-acetyltransferase [Ramlibacter sp.]